MIRKDLKAAFPATKFSVTTKSFAGGCSTSVRWTDGPTAKRVEEIVGRYNNTHFDGMIDLKFTSDSWLEPDGTITPASSPGTEGSRGVRSGYDNPKPSPDAERVHFGSGWVSCSRQISPAFAERLVAQIAEFYGVPAPKVTDTSTKDYVSYSIENGNTKPRPDAPDYWYTLVHQAAQDREKFSLARLERERLEWEASRSEREARAAGAMIARGGLALV